MTHMWFSLPCMTGLRCGQPPLQLRYPPPANPSTHPLSPGRACLSKCFSCLVPEVRQRLLVCDGASSSGTRLLPGR